MLPFLIGGHLGEPFFHQQYLSPDLVGVEFAGKSGDENVFTVEIFLGEPATPFCL